MLVINLLGAPHSGKTNVAHGLAELLSRSGVQVDYFPELARMAHYTNNTALLNDELFLLADKHHRLTAFKSGGVQVAVIDGAILNSLVYRPEPYFAGFDEMTLAIHQSYENLNFLIPGVRAGFSSVGRGENERREAEKRGQEIQSMLNRLGEPYFTLDPEGDMALQAAELSGLLKPQAPAARRVSLG